VKFFPTTPTRKTALRIHAHIQRAVGLHGKAAQWIVELHGRNTEVGQNTIHAGQI
jgi:hypothetical protein